MAAVGVVLLAATLASSVVPGAAMAATDTQSSSIEDGAYPGADQILATQNVKLIAGDGHILLVPCPAIGDPQGLITVHTADQVNVTYPGQLCFKLNGNVGRLDLQVPAVFDIHGDWNTAHQLSAELVVETGEHQGEHQTVTVPPSGSQPVGVGAGGPSTMLLQLKAGDGMAPVTGDNPAIGKLDAGGRGCTATMIYSDWIVTAASCFADNPDQPSVAAGAPARDTHVVFPGHDAVAVAELMPRSDRDLVLARLASPIGDITPAKFTIDSVAPNSTLQETGYGRAGTGWITDAQHTATTTVASLTDTVLTGNVTAGLVCKGDAGAPAFNASGEVVAINTRAGQAGCSDASSTNTQFTDTRLDNIAGWVQLRFATTLLPGALNPQVSRLRPPVSQDLISVDSLGQMFRWPGTSTLGVFDNPVRVPGNWSNYHDFAVGSFTADFCPDLLAAETATGKLWLFPTATFLDPRSRVLICSTTPFGGAPYVVGQGGWNGMHSLVAGDFNGDGWDDILAVETATGAMRLYPGAHPLQDTGPGTVIGLSGWNGMQSFTVGQFAATGGNNLLVVETATGKLKLYASASDIGSGNALTVGTAGWTPMKPLTAGRFHGTSNYDLITVANDTREVYLYSGHPGITDFNSPLQID